MMQEHLYSTSPTNAVATARRHREERARANHALSSGFPVGGNHFSQSHAARSSTLLCCLQLCWPTAAAKEGAMAKTLSMSGGGPLQRLGSSQSTGAAVAPPASSGAEQRVPEASIARDARSDASAGTLVVGPQIVLSGEVKSCNRLVVEGTIKANIKECRDVAIAEGGLFSGSAAVLSAEISGRFEGKLTVSGRLLIRAPGLVSGTVRYKEIEIERGG